MLRAISEIAVAMIVRSVPANPIRDAISRPFMRAVTTSPSRSIGTRVSSGATIAAPALSGREQFHALLKVERRGDIVQCQAQLHHGERDVGLDPDDHGLGAAQPG